MKMFRKYWYVVPVLALSLTPVLWFMGQGTALINGVDTNFPLNPEIWFGRRFFVWNNTVNAGVDFSSSTAGIFFHSVQVVLYKLGLSLRMVELFSFVFWFFLIVLSSLIFSFVIIGRRMLPQILLVVYYSFNIYLFNSWENVKVANLALVSAIPLTLSILILFKRGKINYYSAGLYSALVGLLVSGAGINPAYFLTLFLIIAIYFVGDLVSNPKLDYLRLRSVELLYVSFFILIVNFFWMLPTAHFVFGSVSSQNSIDVIGFTNWVDSLSSNTSIFNVLRLQGAWDWYPVGDSSGLPLYIPYAVNYFNKVPFIAYSLVLPILAIASLTLRSKRMNGLYISFAAMVVAGVFLGAGTHEPTGEYFKFISSNLPFFSLFRSPWYIFTPMLVLAYSSLAGLFLVYVHGKIHVGKTIYLKLLLVTSVFILVAGNFLYSYPLVTGKIFRPNRNDGFYVDFPDYVFTAGEWVSTSVNGRIIGYPDDEIENFEWRYRGIDSILTLNSTGEVLFAPLNMPGSPIAKSIRRLYLNLKKSQVASARNIAGKLAIEYIFEKGDQPSLAPSLPVAVRSGVNREFGKWRFYEFSDGTPMKIFSPRDIVLSYSSGADWLGLGLFGRDSIIVNSGDSVVKALPGVKGKMSSFIPAVNLQTDEMEKFVSSPSVLSNRLMSRNLDTAGFTFSIPTTGEYSPVLERYKLEDFGVSLNSLRLRVDGKEEEWVVEKVDDSYVYFDSVEFGKGEHEIEFSIESFVLEENFDGYRVGAMGAESTEITIENGNSVLEIDNASGEDALVSFENQFDPFLSYVVQVRYRQVYGEKGKVLISQKHKNGLVKTQVEHLPAYPDWRVFSFYYQPVLTDSEMFVNLQADFTADPLGARVVFDDLSVQRVFTNELFLVKNVNRTLEPVAIESVMKSPVRYELDVREVNGPHVIVFSENYSPDWELVVEGLPLNRAAHFTANAFANAWYIDSPQTGDYKAIIEYKPQRLFVKGAQLSVAGATLSVGLFGYGIFKKRKK